MQVLFTIETQGFSMIAGGATASIRSHMKKLLFLLEALTSIDLLYLRKHPRTPSLYESGVVYIDESEDPDEELENWKDIPTTLKDGYGDCEDLAAWRVAELRRQGIKARCHLRHKFIKKFNVHLYHVLVQHPNGRLEDPSKRLGMK